ncbi:hyaluronan and proteoglycan link protein 1-like [Brachionichthys hirsutus]|uniref:hyaluronan and proteoglycan link protein 1-like n=1 Tax=Brachionichthys hirsutus TaxID=412623 RepID=UPI0036050E80
MVDLLRPLLAACLYLLVLPGGHGDSHNSVYYTKVDKTMIPEAFSSSIVNLRVKSQKKLVWAKSGNNVTIPCNYTDLPELTTEREVTVKWSWNPAASQADDVPVDATRGVTVIVVMGEKKRANKRFRGRVRLRHSTPRDLSLIISPLQVDDIGRYRCEVIYGLEDDSVAVDLRLQSLVFPYSSKSGRYNFTFSGAQTACEEQDASLATPEQLNFAWEEGLNWCNAGWLSDGSVRYPIRGSCDQCGGKDTKKGVRSYGTKDPVNDFYDAFCFTDSTAGSVYLYKNTSKLNFTEAVQACVRDGSQIAKVAQLYMAWKVTGLDKCAAGWLHDRSVRYPITKGPLKCGSSEPGVLSFSFPLLNETFRAYCHRQT